MSARSTPHPFPDPKTCLFHPKPSASLPQAPWDAEDSAAAAAPEAATAAASQAAAAVSSVRGIGNVPTRECDAFFILG